MNAFKLGYEAGDNDLELLANPFSRGSKEWEAWRLGWLGAFDERRARKARITAAAEAWIREPHQLT